MSHRRPPWRLAGILVFLTALGWSAHRANAHHPIFTEHRATSADTAIPMMDPTISHVVYREITPETKRVWLAFDAPEGLDLYVQVGVPVIERLKAFRPAMAVVGPGLPRQGVPFEVPEGCGARVLPTSEVVEPRFFHEPFTNTDSWILRSETVKLPHAGRYYLVGYSPQGHTGKLWLSIGTRESFTALDLLAFPSWKQKVQKFHEVLEEPAEPTGLLFSESFEDTRLTSRGWYDGNRFVLSDGAVAGKHAIQYHFPKGKLTPSDSSGVRHAIEPTEVVHLRFHLKLSPGWSWTNKPYGPHLLHFMTTENDRYHGPAASHLTLYIEPVNGKLRLAAQDIQNKDTPHGLTQGPLRGGYNGQMFDSPDLLFDDKWHCVEAMFKLNSLDLANDAPIQDGEPRGWVDGRLVIERSDVVFRSTDFPKMKFNQFLMLPYFHDGVPHDQTLWIDELAVGTKRLPPVTPKANSSSP